jgi:nitrilase
MRLALYQGPSPAGATDAGLALIDRMLRAAGAAGARMAVFPELFLPGYNFPDPGQGARSLGAWHSALAPLARAAGCGVTAGVAEAAQGALFNAALAIGPDGQLLSHYRKTQLFGPREKRLFRRGERLAMFDFEGRRLALLICYDVEFAPLVRDLAGRGVQVILCPTANMHPFTHVARLTVPAQAVNHGVAIAYANYCGTEDDLAYCGGSVLVNADGAVLAQAGPSEALLVAELPPPDAALLSTQLADFCPLE